MLFCQSLQTDASTPAIQAFRRKLRSFAVQDEFPEWTAACRLMLMQGQALHEAVPGLRLHGPPI